MGTFTQQEHGARRSAEERRPDTGWSAVPIAPTTPRRPISDSADRGYGRSAEVAVFHRSAADYAAGLRELVPVPEPVVLAGRYRLGRRRGVGGASAVYQATDLRLNRPVAVKVLTEDAHGTQYGDRFETESSVHAGLHHPRLVPLLDAGRDDEGHGFLVMPLVEGPTLGQRVRKGPMDPREVRRIGAELADALAYVHGNEVVHRDVKPSNVLLDRCGRVYLADFGAAHTPGAPPLAPPGMVVGTAGYLAPEQAMGDEVTAASDVFALGLVLLEALTGRPEYTGTVLERAAAAVTRPPRIPESVVGSEWATVLRSLLAQEPERRPDCGVVRTMLRAEAGGRSGVTPVAGGMRVRDAAGAVRVQAAPERTWLRPVAGGMRMRAA